MSAVDGLRRLKHRAFLAAKPVRWRYLVLTEPAARWRERTWPYSYDVGDFAGTFLERDATGVPGPVRAVPRRIHVFWTGPNPLTPNRERSLDGLRRLNPDLEVVLVTPENLGDFVVDGSPLHPSYEHLAFIHRGDYLKAYLSHHHGGVVADIKPQLRPMSAVFDRFEASDAWLAGYRIPMRKMTPNMPDPRLERLMWRTSSRRLGQCNYLARASSPLTAEWLAEVERRMDRVADELRAHPGDERGSAPGYPIGFNEILAQVVDPLQLKYGEHLMYDDRLQPSESDYL